MLPEPSLDTKLASVGPETRGEPKVYRSAGVPAFMISAAASSAIAPPRLWPVTTTFEFGYLAAVSFSVAKMPLRASSQDSQKPWLAVQPSQMSVGKS